jgi:hypothetical protein
LPPPVFEKESRVSEVLAGVMAFSITFSVLTSLAFSSTTRKWKSLAAALAREVFPTPGGPTKRQAFLVLLCFGVHDFSHDANLATASSFPIRSAQLCGRYFSAHDLSCNVLTCFLAG